MGPKMNVVYSGGPFDGSVSGGIASEVQSQAQGLGTLMHFSVKGDLSKLVGKRYAAGLIHEGAMGNVPHYYRVTKAEKAGDSIHVEAVYEGTAEPTTEPAAFS